MDKENIKKIAREKISQTKEVQELKTRENDVIAEVLTLLGCKNKSFGQATVYPEGGSFWFRTISTKDMLSAIDLKQLCSSEYFRGVGTSGEDHIEAMFKMDEAMYNKIARVIKDGNKRKYNS